MKIIQAVAAAVVSVALTVSGVAAAHAAPLTSYTVKDAVGDVTWAAEEAKPYGEGLDLTSVRYFKAKRALKVTVNAVDLTENNTAELFSAVILDVKVAGVKKFTLYRTWENKVTLYNHNTKKYTQGAGTVVADLDKNQFRFSLPAKVIGTPGKVAIATTYKFTDVEGNLGGMDSTVYGKNISLK